REQDREALRKWNNEHPDEDEQYIDEDGYLARRPRKPPVSTTLEQRRANITREIRENLPALTKAVAETQAKS
ncbi:MAG TPA: hypothetical protein VMP68_21225, partial [Candidatus Eisenbacteria bacterium]|nr:hypothetical protein [Candidatus Eisenbacteria bacterium]